MTDRLTKKIKAERLLKHTRKRISTLLKTPLEFRGHLDNEEIVKLCVREKHLLQVIEKTKFKKTRKKYNNKKGFF